MDPQDVLAIRFHIGGEFDFDGDTLNYVGGRVEMSHVERDKLSLPELRGFLGDHVTLAEEDIIEFHWLLPGAELSSGLRKVGDDQTCLEMSNSITEGGIAELYVEINNFSPTKETENKSVEYSSASEDEEEGDTESEDEDFVIGDEDTSEDDEEASQFRTNAWSQRRDPSTTARGHRVNQQMQEIAEEAANLEDGDDDPPMFDSSEEASYEDDACAIWNGKDRFEVKQKDKRYMVDIERRTCSCRYWQLAGIPCAHAITSLFLSSKPAEEYIAQCYSVDEYNKIYDHCLMPMDGMDQWPADNRKPKPPAYVKMPGRPRKERRRELGEAKKATKVSRIGTKIKCSKCHKEGHNTRSCGRRNNAKRRIYEAGKEVLETSRPLKKPRKTRGGQDSTPSQGPSTPVKNKRSATSSSRPRSSPILKAIAKKKNASSRK